VTALKGLTNLRMKHLKEKFGFNFIILVIVIAVIAIIVAIAIPKFMNQPPATLSNATNAVAEALSAANSTNYASRKVDAKLGVPVTNCKDVAKALQKGLPGGYTIKSAAVAVDITSTICILNGIDSTTATFTATGIT
jgi:Tfp pilus assembly protein FimT